MLFFKDCVHIFMVNLLIILFSLRLSHAADYPYCFRFTWLGPYLDKDNVAELSCDDLREDATNVPCRLPLVVTHNDSVPDTTDLWARNQKQPDLYGCPMTPGQTCVKYTYTYNKGIQNITYMCAKVNATAGCYHQKYISGLDVEVCLCSSTRGALPCNAASNVWIRSTIVLHFMTGILFLLERFRRIGS